MDALLRRREMLSGNEPLLRKVDYIETDGVAYIDTGIIGNMPRSARIYDLVPVLDGESTSYICGCRKDSGNTRFIFCCILATKKVGLGYGSGVYGNDISAADSIDNHTPMQVQTSLNKSSQRLFVKQAGEQTYTSASYTDSSSISTDRNIYVFAMNNQGYPAVAAAGTRIGTVKIYSDSNFSTAVFDAYPCIYDGEYGFFDRVSNSFFGNAAASGAFTGPQIS